MPQAIIVLADGFEEIEAVTCIDLLRRAGIGVTVLGLDALEVRGARDIWVRADLLFNDFAGMFDAIVLPGGMPGTNNLAASRRLLDVIRHAHEKNKICAAICAAPIVLAAAGILENRKTTCYPGYEKRMPGALHLEEDVVTDCNIITSRAVGTAIPFALEVIRAMVGDEVAGEVGAAILY